MTLPFLSAEKCEKFSTLDIDFCVFFAPNVLPSLYIRHHVKSFHLPIFLFLVQYVTIASLVSLVAHSPRPDMLSSLLLTLQLYNGHGHGTLNGRGYPLVRYIVYVLSAIPYLYYTGIAKVKNSIAISTTLQSTVRPFAIARATPGLPSMRKKDH